MNTPSKRFYNSFFEQCLEFILLGCLILSNCFTLFEHQTYEKDDPTRKMVTLLRNLIWIQRTNSTYDSVNFRDRTSIITYFKKLCQATSLMSEEGVDLEINNLMARIIYKEMKDGSTRFPGVKALAIMKLTADKIHGAFQELGRDDDHSTAKITKIADVEKTGRFVTNEMYEGLKSLYSLLDLDSDT